MCRRSWRWGAQNDLLLPAYCLAARLLPARFASQTGLSFSIIAALSVARLPLSVFPAAFTDRQVLLGRPYRAGPRSYKLMAA